MTPAEIAELARYAQHFNMRFGQFIINCVGDRHLYNIDDAGLMQEAREYYRKHTH